MISVEMTVSAQEAIPMTVSAAEPVSMTVSVRVETVDLPGNFGRITYDGHTITVS